MNTTYAATRADLESDEYDTCSIISLLTALFGMAVPAVVFGFIALRSIEKGSPKRGYNMAICGILLGIIEVALTIVLIVVFITTLHSSFPN